MTSKFIIVGSRFLRSLAKQYRPHRHYWRWPLFLLPFATLFFYIRHLQDQEQKREKTEEEEANTYAPIQSDAERAAGHPIVGVS